MNRINILEFSSNIKEVYMQTSLFYAHTDMTKDKLVDLYEMNKILSNVLKDYPNVPVALDLYGRLLFATDDREFNQEIFHKFEYERLKYTRAITKK